MLFGDPSWRSCVWNSLGKTRKKQEDRDPAASKRHDQLSWSCGTRTHMRTSNRRKGGILFIYLFLKPNPISTRHEILKMNTKLFVFLFKFSKYTKSSRGWTRTKKLTWKRLSYCVVQSTFWKYFVCSLRPQRNYFSLWRKMSLTSCRYKASEIACLVSTYFLRCWYNMYWSVYVCSRNIVWIYNNRHVGMVIMTTQTFFFFKLDLISCLKLFNLLGYC